MADNIENLVLEHLRAMRGDIAALAKVGSEIVLRLQSLETTAASIKQDIAHHYGEIALVKTIYDGMRDRLERIERRLSLADVP